MYRDGERREREIKKIQCSDEIVEIKTKTVPVENKLKIDLSYDPTIPLLDIYPKDFKSIYNNIIMFIVPLMFIAILCITAKSCFHQLRNESRNPNIICQK